MWIAVFIILVFVYFVFIRPVVNPPVKPIPNKIYGEKQPIDISEEDAFRIFLRSTFEKDLLKFYNESKLKGTGFDGYAIEVFMSSMYKSLMDDSLNISQELNISHLTIQNMIKEVARDIKYKYIK